MGKSIKDALKEIGKILNDRTDKIYKNSINSEKIVTTSSYPRLESETEDSARINRIIQDNPNGCIIFLNEGEYQINYTIKYGIYHSFEGVNERITKLNYGGVAGGIVMSTEKLQGGGSDSGTSTKNVFSYKKNFSIYYPNELVTSTSRAIYEAMSNGNIENIYIRTNTLSDGMSNVEGSTAIELDGTSNSTPFKISTIKVSGSWEHAYLIKSNHVHAVGCECAYTKNFFTIDSDSIEATSGPPYNVEIIGGHAYHLNGGSYINGIKGRFSQVLGGFNESTLGYNITTELTYSGVLYALNIYSLGAKRLNKKGGTVKYENLQDRAIYSDCNLVQRRIIKTKGSFGVESAEDTAVVSSGKVHVGSSNINGSVTIRLSGNFYHNDNSKNVLVKIYKCSSDFNSGYTTTGTLLKEVLVNPNNKDICIETYLSNQNTDAYFIATISSYSTEGGYVNAKDVIMTVETML